MTLHADAWVQPNGATMLVLKPLEFLERVAALVPPPRRHLIHFHGNLAPNARVRPALVALARAPEEVPVSPAPVARAQEELPLQLPVSPKRPRLDWASLLRRAFAFDARFAPSGADVEVVEDGGPRISDGDLPHQHPERHREVVHPEAWGHGRREEGRPRVPVGRRFERNARGAAL